MTFHDQLIGALTEFDRKQSGKRGHNPHALAIYFARAALKALRLEDTRRCRARYGKAFVSHPAGRDSFAVTLARDPRSALYSQSMIVRTN